VKEKKIGLNEKDRIARSTTRDCYLHPDNPDRVIKIMRNLSGRSKQDANDQEWRSYQFLQRRFGKQDFFVDCHGFVETTLGRGLVFDCVRDFDGKISRSLLDILTDPEYDLSRVEEALGRFCRALIEKEIPLFDLNLLNILIQVMYDGEYHPVSIDVKSKFNNYEIIPLSSYIPFFARRKVRRRCGRLMDKIRSYSAASAVDKENMDS
jgi:hypothetical protein